MLWPGRLWKLVVGLRSQRYSDLLLEAYLDQHPEKKNAVLAILYKMYIVHLTVCMPMPLSM